jgi:hypothetical protein
MRSDFGMLVIKVHANYELIDEIWIQNKGELAGHSGFYQYKIVKPEGHDARILIHRRSDGYKPLLSMALQEIVYQKKGVACRTSSAETAVTNSKPRPPSKTRNGSADGAEVKTSGSLKSRRRSNNS